MERIPVTSSQVASIGFDEATETLEVEFRSGGIYQYKNVSYVLYRHFLASPSKGAFLAEFIIGDRNNPKYEYTCVYKPEKKEQEKTHAEKRSKKESRESAARRTAPEKKRASF